MSAESAPLATVAIASTVDPVASAPHIRWQAATAGNGLTAEGGITVHRPFHNTRSESNACSQRIRWTFGSKAFENAPAWLNEE